MSVWVCCVRYTVHLRGGTTVKGPNSRLTLSDSRRTANGVEPARAATSTSTECLPFASEEIVCLMGSGQPGAERVRLALVRPADSIATTKRLRSPRAVLGTSGE